MIQNLWWAAVYNILTSAAIRERVLRAREIQAERFQGQKDVYCNAHMSSRMVREVCQLDSAGLPLLKTAMERLQLSARCRKCPLRFNN